MTEDDALEDREYLGTTASSPISTRYTGLDASQLETTIKRYRLSPADADSITAASHE